MNNALSLAQKKGSTNIDSKIGYLIGALIVVVLAVNLAPEMFAGIGSLNTSDGVPVWVPLVLYVIVGAGIVFLIWKSFGHR